MLRWFGRILLVLILVGAAGIAWKWNDIQRLLAVNSLFSEDKITANFSNMDGLFFSTTMPQGDGPVSPLPVGTEMAMPDGVDAWIAARNVTALVVLKDGQVVHETYHKGTDADDLRISWSVAKSFLSALMGIALDEGHIASIDDPVIKYAPMLAGSGYEKATIRNVLNMSSGVTFDEDYLDFWSDINKMGRVLAMGGSMDKFAAGVEGGFAEPGTRWQYVSIDTHVLGMVIRGATGRSVIDYMNEKIMQPLGLEDDSIYLTDGNGVAFVLGGLNLRTRDYARFGQMILQGGMWQGQQIVPAEWVTASTRATAPTAPGQLQYGFQWWIPADEDISKPDHDFFGIGIYGQWIYVDPENNVVIARNAADRAFSAPGVMQGNIDMMRAIAAAAE